MRCLPRLFCLPPALLALAAALAGSHPTTAAPASSTNALFETVPRLLDINVVVPDNPYKTRQQLATVDASLLGPKGPSEIALNLFGDTVFLAIRDRVDLETETRLVWHGHLKDEPFSSVTIFSDTGKVAGSVRTTKQIFQILPASSGSVHAVTEVDSAAFPAEAHPIVVKARAGEPPPSGPTHGITERQDAGDPVIDVMVVYTPAARRAAGSESAINSHISLAVAETNQAYANSGINQRLRLVYTYEVDYNQSGSMGTDLSRLSDNGDGYMDEIHALRNSYGADLVSMITDDGTYCGLAYLMWTPSVDFASSAFSVVHIWCATGYFSFAHELGHNMGALPPV